MIELPPVQQVGFVVKDVDKAVEYYSATFGWGPFRVQEYDLKGYTFRGKTGDCRLKVAFAQSGPIEIEFIEVLEGETPHSEFLRENGEGIQHLRFQVKNLDVLVAELGNRGIKPVFQKTMPHGAFVYLENEIGGAMFELIEYYEKQPQGV